MLQVETLAEAIRSEGVALATCVPDEMTVFLGQSLIDRGVRVIRPRHEHGAVLIADGYSRATGDVGLAVIGHGPALTQALGALSTSQKKGSRVLVIVGRSATRPAGKAKEIDELGLVSSTGTRFLRVRGPTTLNEDVSEAFRQVRQGRGPVVLQVPAREILMGAAPSDGPPYRPSPRPVEQSYEGIGSGPAGEDAAAILSTSRYPLIFAGRGVLEADAAAAVHRLADRVGAVVATSLQARGLFGEYPRDIGIIGTYAREAVPEVLALTDCVVAVGASLNPYQTGGRRLAPNARIIQIDRDAAAIGRYSEIDLGIAGDASAVVESILVALDQLDFVAGDGWLKGPHASALRQAQLPATPTAPTVESPLPSSALLSALDRMLPKDRCLIGDGGFFMNYAMDHLSVNGPSNWFWTLDFAAIGGGLGIGIGVAIARQGTLCVLVAGDGGFSMNLQELATVAHERIPLLMIVMNNDEYEAEGNYLRSYDMPEDLAMLDAVDFAAIASAFGIPAIRIQEMADLAELEGFIDSMKLPLLVDARVTRDDHRARARYV